MSSVSFRMLLASSNQVIFSASEKLSGFLASTKFDLGDLTRNLRWLLCWLIQWIHWGHCIPLMLKVTARGHGVTMSCWDTSSPITWTWGWRLFLKHVGSEGQCEELKQFRLAPGGERKKVREWSACSVFILYSVPTRAPHLVWSQSPERTCIHAFTCQDSTFCLPALGRSARKSKRLRAHRGQPGGKPPHPSCDESHEGGVFSWDLRSEWSWRGVCVCGDESHEGGVFSWDLSDHGGRVCMCVCVYDVMFMLRPRGWEGDCPVVHW